MGNLGFDLMYANKCMPVVCVLALLSQCGCITARLTSLVRQSIHGSTGHLLCLSLGYCPAPINRLNALGSGIRSAFLPHSQLRTFENHFLCHSSRLFSSIIFKLHCVTISISDCSILSSRCKKVILLLSLYSVETMRYVERHHHLPVYFTNLFIFTFSARRASECVFE